MKTSKYILFAVAAMAAVSCAEEIAHETNDVLNQENLVPMTFTAFSEGATTKVGISSETTDETSTYKLSWKGTEENPEYISVLSANNDNVKFKNTTEGYVAEFSAEQADDTDNEYYAVYPSQDGLELVKDSEDHIVAIKGINVPYIQTATAGTFDPDAYVAVAKSTDGKTFNFLTVGTFIRFQLEDATDVKSVRLYAKNVTNLACTAPHTTVTENSVSHAAGEDSYSDVSTYIMLQEGEDDTNKFKNNTDYYIITRQNNFEDGITIYVEYDDGTVKSITGQAALYPNGGSRNKVKNLGILPEVNLKEVTDLHALYEMGYDIDVAGNKVNKTTYPSATLITTENNSTVANGLTFIDPDATGVTLGSNLNNSVIIGRYSDRRSQISISDYCQLQSTTNNDQFIAANIDFNSIITSKDYVFTITGNSNYELIAFLNCSLIHPADKQFFIYCSNITNSVATGIHLNNLTISNSEIQLITPSAERTVPKLIGTNASANVPENTLEFTKIYLYNNIFFSTTDLKEYRLFANAYISFNTLILERNSFINVYPGNTGGKSYIYGKTVSNLRVYANLFHIPNYTTVSNNTYTAILNCTTDPISPTVQYNVGYYGGTRPTPYMKWEASSSEQFHPANLTDSPYTQENINNKNFVNAGNYGATR